MMTVLLRTNVECNVSGDYLAVFVVSHESAERMVWPPYSSTSTISATPMTIYFSNLWYALVTAVFYIFDRV